MRIAVIMPRYFYYMDIITAALRKKGYHPVVISDKIEDTMWHKSLCRYFNKLYRQIYQRQFKRKLLALGPFKKVLVINGEGLHGNVVNFLRSTGVSEIILYLWDSLKSKPNSIHYRNAYDRVYTFDRVDSLNYGLEFLPLFHNHSNNNKPAVKKYDCVFVGTVHGNRCDILRKIMTANAMLNFKIYLFSPNQFHKFYHLCRNLYHGIYFKIYRVPLPTTSLNEFIDCSKSVIDIESFNQTGLTIRTIESIARGNKLVTTNSEIANYDFFDERILIVGTANKYTIDSYFLNADVLPSKIVEKYHISNWLDTIISTSA